MITFLDACPQCPPGVPDAAPAVGEPEEVPGGRVTNHGPCELCHAAWSTLWAGGWPVERVVAPVAAGEAAA